jgi:hypothetical protein
MVPEAGMGIMMLGRRGSMLVDALGIGSSEAVEHVSTLFSAIPPRVMASAANSFLTPVLAKWANILWKPSRWDSGLVDTHVGSWCFDLGPGRSFLRVSNWGTSPMYCTLFFCSWVAFSVEFLCAGQ